MKARQAKSCWNCEADVGAEVTYCPFCGMDLASWSAEPVQKDDHRFSSQSLQESLASLYKPPYSVRNQQGFGVPDEREDAVVAHVTPSIKEAASLPEYHLAEQKEKKETQSDGAARGRGGALPLLVLSIGCHLSLLGLLTLFFSRDGFVYLKWSSRYWFLYCLVGMPLVYFGSRFLNLLGISKSSDM